MTQLSSLFILYLSQVSPSDQSPQAIAKQILVKLNKKWCYFFDDSNTNIFFDLLLSVCGTETDIYTETMAIHNVVIARGRGDDDLEL